MRGFLRPAKPRNRRVPRRRPVEVAAPRPSVAPADSPPAGPARRLRELPRRWRWVAGGGLVLLLAFAIVAAPLKRRLAAHPAFAVRAVGVSGEEHASKAELLRLAAIEPGSSWLTLDTAAVARRIESEPWVRRARVLRPWPGRVRLAVDEYEPIARVEIARRIYGICRGLQVVPSADEALPLIRTRGRESTDPDALGRGLAYLASLRKAGLLKRERVELELTDADGDRLTLPDRGFAAVVDGSVPVPTAVKNVASFLERLDAEGGSRGTLRLISDGTAVWRAATGRPGRVG